jgi:hypothetical protein
MNKAEYESVFVSALTLAYLAFAKKQAAVAYAGPAASNDAPTSNKAMVIPDAVTTQVAVSGVRGGDRLPISSQ